MDIKKMFLTVNKYSRPGTALKAVKGIVIHYVGNPNTSAEANRNYFENLKIGKKNDRGDYVYASSQYIIGLAGEIVRCVPEDEVAYCSNNRNNDTISIECCHPKADGKFTDATYKSLVSLVADICRRYRLNPLKDVIRHYDVTGKACPLYHVNNPLAWDGLLQDTVNIINGAALPEKGFVNLCLDGITTELKANNVDGFYMAKISELARALGDIKIPVRYVLDAAGKVIGWDETTKTITAFDSDYEILCKLAQAEAGGEDVDGRVLVANVVMNRVCHSGFPNTIREVVFEDGQFEPTRNGAYIKAEVSESTREAVILALNGTDYSKGALFFRPIKDAENSWHEKNRIPLFDHGGHRFYL